MIYYWLMVAPLVCALDLNCKPVSVGPLSETECVMMAMDIMAEDRDIYAGCFEIRVAGS